MWTPTALASSAVALDGLIWRVVEHQYTTATRRIVDSQADHELLEDILERSKPRYPSGTEHLDYLLKTPFRYPPVRQTGSRFRRPDDLDDRRHMAAAEQIYLTGRTLVEQGKFSEAVAELTKAEDAFRKFDVLGHPFWRVLDNGLSGLAHTLYLKGQCLENLGDCAGALLCYETSLINKKFERSRPFKSSGGPCGSRWRRAMRCG